MRSQQLLGGEQAGGGGEALERSLHEVLEEQGGAWGGRECGGRQQTQDPRTD